MMKIIFINPFGKGLGGGGYSLFKFAEGLALRGHEVIIFGLSKDNKYLEGTSIPKNLQLFDRFYVPRKFKGAARLDKIVGYLFSRFTIEPYLRKNRADFICGSLRTSAIAVSLLGKKYNIPSVNFVFETPPWMEHDLKERWFKEYKGSFKKSWERTKKAYLATDILISNSALSKKWCEKWLGDKKVADFVYPGITLSELEPIHVKKKKQVIYIGRLDPYKNIDIVIKALSAINNAPIFVIAGGGKEERKLRKMSIDLGVKCGFTGVINDAEKWKLIRESMFMVFPSSHEGFGMPPMEALACEIPCLCSEKPIFREVYEDKVEYFKENDAEDLRKKIEYLIKNPGYRNKRGKDGREYIEKGFSWKKSAEKIEKILISNLRKKK
ncbi:glycosyltransferase family 4 protein [Candidatus Woesearchaeota archaeon]|nr:glycosyltransferase family 4 protein [Candidatus Woesearchaeota archaeon]